MKKIILWFMAGLCGVTSIDAQTYKKTQTGVEAEVNDQLIELSYYSPSVVRVLKYPKGKSLDKNSLAVIAQPQKVLFSQTLQGNTLCLNNKILAVRLDMNTGKVSFARMDGTPLISEKNAAQFVPMDDVGTPAYRVGQTFVLDADEPVYGLGIPQNGQLSQRNVSRKLIQGNTEDAVPFIQSVKGYGVYWDNCSPTQFVDDANGTLFESEVGDCVDYYFMYGGNADGVIADMRKLTGEVPMVPLWTYGFWQSRERYKSQNETVGVVRRYRELGVPLDGIIQDWQYWGNNYQWNSMEFLNPDFSRPQQMVDEIHGMNAHMIISIWSSFGPQTQPYKEMEKIHALFNFQTWPQSAVADVWPPIMSKPSGVRAYDPYNPEARDIYWKYLNKGIFSLGMDGWWMDSTEPDHLDFKDSDLNAQTYMGSFRKVRNAYPLMCIGGVYNHQREACSSKRVFILTRSAFAGQQRYGANTWSGDVSSSWNSFRAQIPAGLNFTMTGNPNFNTDLGGFFAGRYNKNNLSGTQNPLFQELYVRWLQYGVFSPMMRSHGTEVPREIYEFGKPGEPVFDAIAEAIRLRYSLVPYIYSTAWQVSKHQSSFLRALPMDFANDRRCWNISNEYMFGSAFLVAPVDHAQYTPEDPNAGSDQQAGVNFKADKQMDVYLPKGAQWYDYYTSEKYEGGRQITLTTTLNKIPLFVKAGSIITTAGYEVQYISEKPWDLLNVTVYPGKDAQFTLYEDEGDNYNYEKGAYTEIPMTWNEKNRTLTIGSRKGKFKGMLKSRIFKVGAVDSKVKKEVVYHGKQIKVQF